MSVVSPTPKPEPKKSWTLALRERAVEALPPERLLADRQPTYVSSWIYVFGVLSLASLVSLILSGTILALKGPTWWHYTGIGHFFNSIHVWGVELFFFFMVIHLWGKYWMAAWRGGRTRTWVTGAICFLVAIPCALTGYVSQQNFDAQWISTQAKDAMNSAGVGAFFNLTNFGQMYSYHVFLLPVVVVAIVIAHVLLVRRHGVVPPFELAELGAGASGAAVTGAPVTGGADLGPPQTPTANGAPTAATTTGAPTAATTTGAPTAATTTGAPAATTTSGTAVSAEPPALPIAPPAEDSR